MINQLIFHLGKRSLSSRRDEQEHRTLEFFGQFGPFCDLLLARTPFLHMPEGEARTDEEVERRCDHAVLLDDAGRQPVRAQGCIFPE